MTLTATTRSNRGPWKGTRPADPQTLTVPLRSAATSSNIPIERSNPTASRLRGASSETHLPVPEAMVELIMTGYDITNLDAHLAQLVRQGKITRKLAEARAAVPDELRRLLGAGAAPVGLDLRRGPAPRPRCHLVEHDRRVGGGSVEASIDPPRSCDRKARCRGAARIGDRCRVRSRSHRSRSRRRVGRLRAVTLEVTPPKGMPLQKAMDRIDGIVSVLREKGAIPPGSRVLFWHTGGTAALPAFADKLL